MKGEIYCLGCKQTLPKEYADKESWKCPHCGSIEYDYGLRPISKDIICPDCKGMLEDTETTTLYCPNCNTNWRV